MFINEYLLLKVKDLINEFVDSKLLFYLFIVGTRNIHGLVVAHAFLTI